MCRYLVAPKDFFGAAASQDNALLALLAQDEILFTIIAWLDAPLPGQNDVPDRLCKHLAMLMGAAKFFRLHHGLEHPNELRAKASPGEVQVNAQGETIEIGPSFDAVLETCMPAYYHGVRTAVRQRQ